MALLRATQATWSLALYWLYSSNLSIILSTNQLCTKYNMYMLKPDSLQDKQDVI